MTKRREILWSLNKNKAGYNVELPPSSDIELCFTRKGIEVSGYYDSIVGMGDTALIPWAEVQAWKEQVERR